MRPFFTVSIPAYKSLYLKECIESVLSQTYDYFEMVIVDDASPENLHDIVFQYNDKRIRFYRNSNNCGAVNVVDNWNICLGYSKGDYIICMGDDDRLLPNCLEEYARLINIYPNRHIYHARTQIINEHSEFYLIQEPRPIEESVYSMIWNRWQGRLQYIGDFLFEVSALKANGGFYKLPLAWASDDISAFIAAKDGGIVNSQVPLFQYRVNSDNISSTSNAEIKLQAIKQERAWYNDFLFFQPYDGIDVVYHKMILEDIDKRFRKKLLLTIRDDIVRKSSFRIFYWAFRKKQVELSFADIIFIFLEVLKHKYVVKKLR